MTAEGRVYFELSAYSTDRAPEEVTAMLAIEPHKIIRAGGPSAFPELGPIPQNGWFHVGTFAESSEPDGNQLFSLLTHLGQHRDELQYLRSVGWEIAIIVGLLPNETEPILPQTVRQRCADLGLSISVFPVHDLIGSP